MLKFIRSFKLTNFQVRLINLIDNVASVDRMNVCGVECSVVCCIRYAAHDTLQGMKV